MTSSQDNADQIAYWSGRAGDVWTRNQDTLDRMLAPLMPALLDAIAPMQGETLLDVGCGCGALSLALAERVGASGRIVGVDVSTPMLARARARPAPAHAKIEWIEADAAAHAFGAATFDAVVSRFGVMFFSDPVAAFRNMRPALKPGGRLVFLCWRPPAENAWAMAPVEIASRFIAIPAPQPGYQPGPFGFADADFVKGVLSEAGFSGARLIPVDTELGPVGTGVDDISQFYMQVGPMSRFLADADDQTKDKLRAALKEWVADDVLTGRFRPKAGCWIVTAT